MKFRFAFSAFCMLVAMTMATDAIAQVSVFRVTSGTESRGRASGHAEKAGDISLFTIDGSITAAGDERSRDDRVWRADHERCWALCLQKQKAMDNNINILVCSP